MHEDEISMSKNSDFNSWIELPCSKANKSTQESKTLTMILTVSYVL